MSTVKTFKRGFVTPAVRAVFPNLQKPDKFGNYSVDVDLLDNPELRMDIEEQADEVLRLAHEELDTTREPTNALFRTGTIKKGEREGEEFLRASFKMRSTRKSRGKEVPQKPRVVDAKRNPVSEQVFGGSKVKVAYDIQFTLMPTGTYLSLKLKAVQVLEHVGPGGDALIEDIFSEEEGFESQGVDAASVPAEDDFVNGTTSGADF